MVVEPVMVAVVVLEALVLEEEGLVWEYWVVLVVVMEDLLWVEVVVEDLFQVLAFQGVQEVAFHHYHLVAGLAKVLIVLMVEGAVAYCLHFLLMEVAVEVPLWICQGEVEGNFHVFLGVVVEVLQLYHLTY